MKLFLRNGRIIDPVLGRDESLDILIVNGRIEQVGSGISSPRDGEVIDCKGKIVTPGFIDMHVHLREPGFEHKETIETGCLAAAHGGFTAVCCMPNTNPAIDDASIVRMIQNKSKQVVNGIVDVYPIAAVTKGREGKLLAPMIELAEAGAVAFSDDGAPVTDSGVMRRALEYASMLRKPVIQHAEELSLTKGGAMNEGFVSTTLGMPAMPPVAESMMVERDIQLVRYIGGTQYHVAHVSTAKTIELVRAAKREGLPVSCEVTPHHFVLTDEEVRSFDTNTKMNPPLRTREDVEAIREGLRDGTIEVIATDHAPHSYDEKQVEYTASPFGIIGLETAIGLSIRELVQTGIIDLVELVRKLSTNPRRILHLPEVKIAEGEPANFTIIDPSLEWKVDVQRFHSKSKNSPFNGWTLIGKSIGVVNNGNYLLPE